MDQHNRHSRVTVRNRSRRRFLQAIGAGGIGLTASTTVASLDENDGENEDGGTGEDDGVDGTDGDDGDDGSTDENATARDRTSIDSPTMITEPGEYELVSDIVPETLDREYCIAVDLGETDGTVTIYGNGHTIDLSDVERGDCIISNPNYRGSDGEGPGWVVHVENLTVKGGNSGITTAMDTGGRFTDITAVGNNQGVAFYLDSGVLTNCILEENRYGAFLHGSQIYGGSDVRFEDCTIRANEANGVRVSSGYAMLTSSRIVGNATGVYVDYTDATANLDACHICGNEEFGIEADAATDEESGEGNVQGFATATNNYWGAPNGPSSYGDPEEQVVDRETGRPADGDGDAISESLEPGVSNVRFDPFRDSPIDGVGAER